ncbi:MAG: glycosyltransferase family 4 protein [Actinomycetia bacterium]|nr:glycosyltransferase family 4 protein [Actinomycetes bacterium]
MNTPEASDEVRRRIADLAEEAGIRTVHMLAWRDLDDDEAGGSEIHAHNIASIWVQSGIEVTHRTSASGGRPPEADREGYRVVRRGSRYSVFPRAGVAEAVHRYGPCDGLVEIWNGMPFASPIWRRGPRMIWLHHIHGPMWGMSLPKPIAAAGVFLEERIGPKLYRNQPIVTLSRSSEEEMLELGFPAQNITVITPGVDPGYTPKGPKNPTPLVMAVGRLVPVKNFGRLVGIWSKVVEKVPDAELVIVGEGYERPDIEAEIARLGLRDSVRLPGRVSDAELLDLYRRSWAVASASVREGWGMTLTEAAACGTPTVATDIAGHADAVAPGSSGILADTDDDIAAALTQVLTDSELRAQLSEGAVQRASELTWQHAALANFEVLAADARRRNWAMRNSR